MGNENVGGMKAVRGERFVSASMDDLKSANQSPISGYEHLPIMKLDEAVEKLIPLVPGLMAHVAKAKDNCNRTSTLLSHEESAAIFLYTMPIPFFRMLNKALRAKNRDALKPCFAYLRLFLAALEKLPSLDVVIWRGVAANIGSDLVENNVETWWSINSCSRDTSVVETYLRNPGTVFTIQTTNGKDISSYSRFPDEQEVVLVPGTRLHIKSKPLAFEERLFIVHMEDVNTSGKKLKGASADNGNQSNNIKESSASAAHVSKPDSNNQKEDASALLQSLDLSFIEEKPFKKQWLSSIIGYSKWRTMNFWGSLPVMSSNHELLLLYGCDTFYLVDRNLEVVKSTKNNVPSSKRILDITWGALIQRFIVISKDHVYAFDSNTAQLTCIESISLRRGQSQFISCACSDEKLFIAAAKSCYPYYVNQYNLQDFTFVCQYTVTDLIGSQIPPEVNHGQSKTVDSVETDERTIIMMRANKQRLALLLEIQRQSMLYVVNLTKQPFRSKKLLLPSIKCQIQPLIPSDEWLVICDGYKKPMLQVSLDCKFKKEYSSEQKWTQNKVRYCIMIGPSRFVVIRDTNLEMYHL